MMEFQREKNFLKMAKYTEVEIFKEGKIKSSSCLKICLFIYILIIYMCGLFGMKYVNVSEESLEARRGYRSL